MIKDDQVVLLRKLVFTQGEPIRTAAAKTGMSEPTARKYLRLGRLPSETKEPRTWRTRKDPFADVWEEATDLLRDNPQLKATELFDVLQRRYPGKFKLGQLRTLQRRVKRWKALFGPPKDVLFEQVYPPEERGNRPLYL